MNIKYRIDYDKGYTNAHDTINDAYLELKAIKNFETYPIDVIVNVDPSISVIVSTVGVVTLWSQSAACHHAQIGKIQENIRNAPQYTLSGACETDLHMEIHTIKQLKNIQEGITIINKRLPWPAEEWKLEYTYNAYTQARIITHKTDLHEAIDIINAL